MSRYFCMCEVRPTMFVGDRKMHKSNNKLVQLDVKENDIIFNGE